MYDFLTTLVTTTLKRPYVLAFLIAYLLIAYRILGSKWTVSFLSIGYALAFLSEFCAINYGIPYGWYHYVYENLAGEWLNHGVPVWDSVSYVFMNFAGLCAAWAALGQHSDKNSRAFKIRLWLLSALMVLLLDVVTDPLAHQGTKWFLGRIYYYPNPGWYFDVTMANFLGWYVTSLAINGCGIFLLHFTQHLRWNKHSAVLALGLYYGIFAFTTGITAWIGAWPLVACDAVWIALTIRLVAQGLSKSLQD
jgi:uncharacterized membrane protein